VKPERQIRATYADLLPSADPTTLRIVGDLDDLYTSAPIPATPPFKTLIATRARAASQIGADDGPESAMFGNHRGMSSHRSKRGWLRQGFAFAGAAVAFTLVAAILVLLFQNDDERGITPGAQPTVASTGVREIAYVSHGADDAPALVATRSDGSGTRTILSGGMLSHPAWSPDGRWIAVAAGGDKPIGIYIIDALTGDARQITHPDGTDSDQWPTFSPDGSQIAFVRSGSGSTDLWIVDIATGTPDKLTTQTNAQSPVWSPDGTQIAFTNLVLDGPRPTADVYTIDIGGSAPRKIIHNPGWDTAPTWNPDGTQLAFVSDRDGSSDIFIVNADGSGLRNLTDSPSNESYPAWSPDGNWIVFANGDDGAYSINIMRSDGSDIIHIADAGEYNPPTWSPDSQQIAYVTFPPMNADTTAPRDDSLALGTLHVVNRDGSGHVILSDTVAFTAQLAWSPVLVPSDDATPEPSQPVTSNPDQIAFTSIRDGNPEIYLVNADGTDLTRLTDNPAADRVMGWSPDGRLIAFISNRDGGNQLFTMFADGSGVRRVTSELDIAGRVVWSPDGAWIAFTANGATAGFFDIYVCRPNGSDLRKLSDTDGVNTDVAWSVTSQQIAYRSDGGQAGKDEIVVVNIDGSGRKYLTNDGIGQREPDWSPDGARLAFGHASHEIEMPDNSIALADTIAFYLLTMQGGEQFRPTEIVGSTPRWSPDGTYLAFRRYAASAENPVTTAETLHIVQADGLETGRIVGIEGAMLDYDWSADGQALSVVMSNVNPDGGVGDDRSLWVAQLDGSAPVQIADQLEHNTGARWRPDPSRTPELTKTPPYIPPIIETPTTDTLIPNGLENLAPLQPSQERHFTFDISADYRSDESDFLQWNVEGSERILEDGTRQLYLIARDESDDVIIEYVNNGERYRLAQRGWIETDVFPGPVATLPHEFGIALLEPRLAGSRLFGGEAGNLIDERRDGNVQISRYATDSMERIDEQLGVEVGNAYYEIFTTADPVQVMRTRQVVVATDGTEYTLFDITFESVVIVPAESGPGNYVVPDAPAGNLLRYTPPARLPNGFTLERHERDAPARETLIISGPSDVQITGIISPSRGGYDTRVMQQRAIRVGGMTVATGDIAGGVIAWMSEEANGWPVLAIWDNGHYRIELSIDGVTSRDQWDENDLVTLIYALAGEQPE